MGEVFVAIAVVVGVVAVAIGCPYVLVHGFPVAGMRARFAAWRIRRTYRRKVETRALQLQTDDPSIPFECGNWPRYKSLCGYCCAVSRADRELQNEQAAINEVIRATLR